MKSIRFAAMGALAASLVVGVSVRAQEPPVVSAGMSLAGLKIESGYAESDGGKIFYEVAGQGQDMIFIHDGLLHREVWDHQFPVFADRYRVIRYDRRGYGLSPRPERAYSDLTDLHRIFEKVGVDSAILVGMSAGGRLAIDFALEYPSKVSALVLVGAVLRGYTYSEHFYTRGGRLGLSDYANTEKMLSYWFDEDPYEIAPGNDAARLVARKLLAANPQNLNRDKFNLAQQPARQALGSLHKISVPTLVVIGEHDIPDVHAHGGAIESGIRNAQRIVMSDAAHLVPLEQPEDFNNQVSLFLSESAFLRVLRSQGIAGAVKALEEARLRDPEVVPFRESKINIMGYRALQAGNVDEALELFKLNVIAFPESWNVFDSLAEAYFRKGEVDLAVENYEKSLQLNPENTNARTWLERLREQ